MICPGAVVLLLDPSATFSVSLRPSPERGVSGTGRQELGFSRTFQPAELAWSRGSLRSVHGQIRICWFLLPSPSGRFAPERAARTLEESTPALKAGNPAFMGSPSLPVLPG